MKPEGSLPRVQVPATCPYPEPDRSNPNPQNPIFTISKYSQRRMFVCSAPQTRHNEYFP
jgi:hypothetical protein